MKTAEEILKKHLDHWYTHTDPVNRYFMRQAMEEYAAQFKDIASAQNVVDHSRLLQEAIELIKYDVNVRLMRDPDKIDFLNKV